MRKIYTLTLVLLACGLCYGQQNVGIGIMNPDPSALLDLTSGSKGFLVPRMSGAARLAIATPANGLLVYDTDSSCVFFYTGTAWQNLCVPNNGGKIDSVYFNPNGMLTIIDGTGQIKTTTLDAWLTNGNSGTNPANNFVGTTDAQDVVIRSNNSEVMRATQSGSVGINQPTPNVDALLDMVSTTKGVLFPSLTTVQRDAIATPTVGLVVYNNTINVHQFWNGTCWVNVGQTVCAFSYSMNFVSPAHTSDCLEVSNFASVSDTISVNLVNGTPSPVILTATGMPAGVLVNFSNNYLLPPQTSIMTFTALPSALSGTYTITILATSGSTVQTLTYTLTVYGYNLTLNPPDTTVSAGNLGPGGYISQTLVSIGNPGACGTSGGTAILSVSGVPSYLNVSFGTSSLAIPGSTTMTITSNCPPAGIYTLTVQAQVGVTSSYANYVLTVTAPAAIHVTTSQNNLNLAALIGPNHCAGSDTIYIDPGVNICSSSATSPAITTGTLPAGGSIILINNGSIIGAGGAGGGDPANVGQATCPTADGQAGGDAIDIAQNITTTIINNGTIASGGGGGGAGAALSGTNLSVLCNFSFGNAFIGGSGGGGAGCTVGPGGSNSSCAVGQPGTATTGGAGGVATTSGNCGCNVNLFIIQFSANAGSGGAGGALGTAGAQGGSYNDPGGVTLSTSCPAGQGGAAGYSVNGNGCSCAIVTGNPVTGPIRP